MHADVRALIDAGNVDAPLADVNPFAFALPIAPELAARAARRDDRPRRHRRRLCASRRDARTRSSSKARAARSFRSRAQPTCSTSRRGSALPVLLVVGIRLGCLNHALLSALAIDARGLVSRAGSRTGSIRRCGEGDANVATLVDRLPAPLCADFAWRADGVHAFAVDRAALRAARIRFRRSEAHRDARNVRRAAALAGVSVRANISRFFGNSRGTQSRDA